MESRFRPVIDIDDLHEELRTQYGEDFIADLDNANGLRYVLFGDHYMNDCYKSLWLEIEPWEKVEDPLLCAIKTFLQDIFPEYDSVLINVSW